MTPGAPSRRSVLVVDDEAQVRALLVLSLQLLGADAWALADGPDALAIFTQRASEIDLALIDLHLPGMDGEDVAAVLHQIDAALPRSGWLAAATHVKPVTGAGAPQSHRPRLRAQRPSCRTPSFRCGAHSSPARNQAIIQRRSRRP
jgi:CheY-like chemotaxis protein